MSNESKNGTPWRDDELDAIVADYFAMLEAEIAGLRYIKSRYCQALMARIERSHRSVEFKHQNAIFDAIDRFLSNNPGVVLDVPAPPKAIIPPTQVFIAPPAIAPSHSRMPDRLQRLVRKFDPVERDRRNRSLGKAGEEFVIDVERRRLTKADRADLARKIRWVAAEDGDGAGYDVHSFEETGHERLVEVKTTNGSARTPFFITRNECDLASERPAEWRIYRVHLFATEPRIFAISPPLEKSVVLRPEVWRASF